MTSRMLKSQPAYALATEASFGAQAAEATADTPGVFPAFAESNHRLPVYAQASGLYGPSCLVLGGEEVSSKTFKMVGMLSFST